ncbi:hypothetical protein OGAPHI_001930 [Ogataea philodendri]|uniref:Uncharacterized protein n=1 Tax=Ogataea philodendri TaxID=1378263 RepID=A0A9P8T6U2_9ASCO|nr:uncharacterized protein OGAPHI_001930 [Ogataea philodendri]KAH3668176.1 hypothetical protein OGAPHI_001930 [Ogataea philodendri]
MSRIDPTPTTTNNFYGLPSDIPSEEYCKQLDLIVRLIYILTGECQLDVSRKQVIRFFRPISSYSGYLSITAWLFAQIPQVIKNYSEESVDGLSLGFLCCWFAGDFLNFTSCLMTDAMFFQTLLSSYYLIIDVVLAGQYYYYTKMYHNPESRFFHHKRSKRMGDIKSPRTALRSALDAHSAAEIDMDPNNHAFIPAEHIASPIAIGNNRPLRASAMKNSLTKLVSSSFIMGFSRANAAPIPNHGFSAQDKINNSALLKILQALLSLSTHQLGKILAWCCTILYIGSRFPQIVTNHKIRTTKGVSPKFILSALLGNLCYSLSLATCQDSLSGGKVSREFWQAELSYLLGAMGTVALDVTLLLQWYWWDYNRTEEYSPISSNVPANRRESITMDHYNKLLKTNSPETGPHGPINMKIPMSPNHARKLSEHTPLSPIDFLLDDYMILAKSHKPKNHLDETLKMSNYGSIS